MIVQLLFERYGDGRLELSVAKTNTEIEENPEGWGKLVAMVRKEIREGGREWDPVAFGVVTVDVDDDALVRAFDRVAIQGEHVS